MSSRTPPSSSPDPLPPGRGGRDRLRGQRGRNREAEGAPGGSRSWPRPVRPRLPSWLAYRLQRVLAPNAVYRWLASRLAASPLGGAAGSGLAERGAAGPEPAERGAAEPEPAGRGAAGPGRALRYRVFTAAERAVKREVFGCRMCGQCALPVTGYACPMTCPKQLRNGPCGGVGADGSCEVFPGVRCVWLTAYERAQRQGRAADLELLHRPADHRRAGESSWVSYWSGADEGLWAPAGEQAGSPGIHRPATPRGPAEPSAGRRR